MRYDPFGSSPPAQNDHRPEHNGTSTANPQVFFPHCPAVLQVPLTPLEWKGDLPSDRIHKRPRIKSETDNPLAVRPTSAPSVTTCVVEKVVEKIITVPASEPVTIMGGAPLVDDRVRNLVNFILQHVTAPGVEIEAKLGLLIQKYQGVRACGLLPVICETPIRPDVASEIRFESSVHHTVFAHLNTELNRRVEATASYPDAGSRVKYLRTREVDLFWPNKVRETRRVLVDSKTGVESLERIRVQRKNRLGDLNFLCPASALDVRYSASLEENAPAPLLGGADPPKRRAKDRISYKFDSLSIDITAVEMTDPEANLFNHSTHEIEIEVESSANLFGEVEKYRAGDPSSNIFRIATSLVNTVRVVMEEVREIAAQVEADAAAGAVDSTATHQVSMQQATVTPRQGMSQVPSYQSHGAAIPEQYAAQHELTDPPMPLEMQPNQVYVPITSHHGPAYAQHPSQYPVQRESTKPSHTGPYRSR
jgi:polynucleotide 5'-triphosphatase